MDRNLIEEKKKALDLIQKLESLVKVDILNWENNREGFYSWIDIEGIMKTLTDQVLKGFPTDIYYPTELDSLRKKHDKKDC